MKWIETIQLRTVDSNRMVLKSKLNNLMNEVGARDEKQIVLAYSRAMIDTDYNIHIMHDSKTAETLGSTLGLRLVSALQEYGLVHHSVWVELTNQ